MARHPLIIGHGDTQRTFASKKEAIALFREMLARYPDDQEIGEEDSQLLRDLLERHPEATDKIGGGVKRFYRARAVGEPTSCFHLERLNGSTTDFSYMSCVNGKGASLYQEFVEACSQAVRQELAHAKLSHFDREADGEGKVRCDVTGERISFKEAQLDHKKPMTFQVIVITFIAAHGIRIEAGMLSAPADNQYVTTFVDKDLERKFQDYHQKIAVLRIVKTQVNRSLGGSEKLTKPKRPVQLKSKSQEEADPPLFR
jgi:hypothetical protein